MNAADAAPPTAPTSVPASSARLTSALLAGLAALLAFFMASTPWRSAEFWRHLANGRQLAAATWPTHDDAFLDSPAAEHRDLVFPLLDLFLYGGHQLLGVPGLQVLGALLAALIPILLFRLGISAHNQAYSGVGALLAALALGPWLPFSPLLLSCLFLALTLVLLKRLAHAAETGSIRLRHCWLLPVLMILWANTDAWVVLGPLAVGLWGLGALSRGQLSAARLLAVLFLVSGAATFLSPNHAHVWSAPLSGRVETPMNQSPLWPSWFVSAPIAPGVAYLGLTLLGLLTFPICRRGPMGSLAPLWLALLILAVWRPQAAPFLMVVAGPAAALGLGACADRWAWERRRWQRALPGLALVCGVLLVVAAWPGWLQGGPPGRRSWRVEVDESLRDAVTQIAAWRCAGAIDQAARTLTFSSAAADYWSWDGPDDTTADRPPRLTDADYAALMAGLLESPARPKVKRPDWRETLRRRRIHQLLVYYDDSPQAARLVERLGAAAKEWPLLYLRGRTLIFGWQDPSQAVHRPGVPLLDLDRRALRLDPQEEGAAPWSQPQAPRAWWHAFTTLPASPPPQQEEAALYLTLFDAQRRHYDQRQRAAWHDAQLAALVGGLADPSHGAGLLPADLGIRFQWARLGMTPFLRTGDDGPPAWLLLAVRAARQALHAQPDDPRSYFLLGEAYLRLAEATRERSWQDSLPLFARFRAIQAITAFHRLLALRPQSQAAQGRLAHIHRQHGDLDLTLAHLTSLLQMSRTRGPAPGQNPETFAQGLEALEQEQLALETEVQRRADFLAKSKSLRPLVLAQEAFQAKLPARALDILLQSDVSEFGAEGARLELELLLWTGHISEFRERMSPDLKPLLGATTYHELRACLAAATGNYAEAERELCLLQAGLQLDPQRPPNVHAAAQLARLLGESACPDQAIPTLAYNAFAWDQVLREIPRAVTAQRGQANAQVIRGLFLLEAGRVALAQTAFRRALQGNQDQAPPGQPLPGQLPGGQAPRAGAFDFAGRRVAEDCLQWLDSVR